jgi:hypothetical protein
MDGRSAIVVAIAVAVAALGLLGYVALEGVAAGLALFVAGLLLVAIGLLGWQDRREPSRGAGKAPVAVPEGIPPGGEGPDHAHDAPIVVHDDLLAHVRDRHGGALLDALTLELRRLHERAHLRSR